MPAVVDARITVGDRQFPLRWTLLKPDGTPHTLTAVTIRMVNTADNVVKINDASVDISAGGGVAVYEFASGDVDTAGVYAIQMRDTVGGKPQRWPVGRDYILEIVAVI